MVLLGSAPGESDVSSLLGVSGLGLNQAGKKYIFLLHIPHSMHIFIQKLIYLSDT